MVDGCNGVVTLVADSRSRQTRDANFLYMAHSYGCHCVHRSRLLGPGRAADPRAPPDDGPQIDVRRPTLSQPGSLKAAHYS